jgi:hypothetical protein
MISEMKSMSTDVVIAQYKLFFQPLPTGLRKTINNVNHDSWDWKPAHRTIFFIFSIKAQPQYLKLYYKGFLPNTFYSTKDPTVWATDSVIKETSKLQLTNNFLHHKCNSITTSVQRDNTATIGGHKWVSKQPCLVSKHCVCQVV